GEEADEERQGDLHQFREQDASYHRADDRQDESGQVAPERGPEQIADDAAEEGTDQGHHCGRETVAPERERETREDQDRREQIPDPRGGDYPGERGHHAWLWRGL